MVYEPQPFFSCDWGTSSFRLRLISGSNGEIEGELEEAQGVRSVREDASNSGDCLSDRSPFADYLVERLEYLAAGVGVTEDPMPVVVSGMASSSIGWKELPYATVPFSLSGDDVVSEGCTLTSESGRRYSIHLISGVATETEMMRGEECELIGLKRLGEVDRSVAILPGSHSKHVVLDQEKIKEWTTCMTGELFDLLKANSVLRFSVEKPASGVRERRLTSEEKAAFCDGVDLAASRGLMASLFQVRTRDLLKGVSPTLNYWRLSGLVVGAEILALQSNYGEYPWVLLAGRKFAETYELAIDQILGKGNGRGKVVPPEAVDTLVVRGHQQLLHRLG